SMKFTCPHVYTQPMDNFFHCFNRALEFRKKRERSEYLAIYIFDSSYLSTITHMQLSTLWLTLVNYFRTAAPVDNTPKLSPLPCSERTVTQRKTFLVLRRGRC